MHHAIAARRADFFHVLEDNADDFAETQRDYGQVITPQTQGRQAHQQSRHRREQAAGEQRPEKERAGGKRIQVAKLVGDDRRRVRAHGHEPRVAERKLAGVAVDQIQADREDDVDADVVKNEEDIGIDAVRQERDQQAECERNQQKEFGVLEAHTFSTSFLPSKPDGLMSRIKIRMPKAMASR